MSKWKRKHVSIHSSRNLPNFHLNYSMAKVFNKHYLRGKLPCRFVMAFSTFIKDTSTRKLPENSSPQFSGNFWMGKKNKWDKIRTFINSYFKFEEFQFVLLILLISFNSAFLWLIRNSDDPGMFANFENVYFWIHLKMVMHLFSRMCPQQMATITLTITTIDIKGLAVIYIAMFCVLWRIVKAQG